MAVRLSVVIAQASSRDRHAGALEEELVAELMMTSGLDPVVVSSLDRIEPGGSDQLCLSGLNNAVVVLSWMDLVTAQFHWQRLQLPGQLVPLGQNKQRDRQQYDYLQLQPDDTVDRVMTHLVRVLQDRRTTVVPLSLQPMRAPDRGASPATAVRQGPDGAPEQATDERPGAVPRPERASRAGPQSPLEYDAEQVRQPNQRFAGDQQQSGASVARQQENAMEQEEAAGIERTPKEDEDDDSRWAHLDRLVDDLDALDL